MRATGPVQIKEFGSAACNCRRAAAIVAVGHRSPYAPSTETPAQINAHSPSDKNSTRISISPRLGRRGGSLSLREWGDDLCLAPEELTEQIHCDAVFLPICSSTPRRNNLLLRPAAFPGRDMSTSLLLECRWVGHSGSAGVRH